MKKFKIQGQVTTLQMPWPTLYEDSSPISGRKLTATCSQCLQATKLLMRSKWQNPNHLLLTKHGLFMNTNVICAMQVMWAKHAEAYFGALVNINILSLVNTCRTNTTWGTKISVPNLQSSRNAVGAAGLFNLWNALHQKQKTNSQHSM